MFWYTKDFKNYTIKKFPLVLNNIKTQSLADNHFHSETYSAEPSGLACFLEKHRFSINFINYVFHSSPLREL